MEYASLHKLLSKKSITLYNKHLLYRLSMRIAFDAKRLYNNFTGLGNHSRSTIDILSTYYPDTELLLYTPKVKRNEVTMPYMEHPHCRTILPSGLLRASLWRTFVVPRQAEQDGAQLFHGLSNQLPIGLRIPCVVTIHDVAFRQFTNMYHWHDRQIYNRKWIHSCNAADRIIAISESTKRDIIHFYDVNPEKIDIVYQPVGMRYYQDITPRPDQLFIQKPYMLYVGSVNSRKNLLGVVQAMRLLPESLRLPLVVVGSGRDYMAKVKHFIAQHNMQQWVIFPDHRVNNDELHQLYLNASLFVYPSFFEGFGLPVVEAALCGCPVLTSNVSSLPEAGGPSAMLANPYSVEDIAAKMEQALSDSALRQRMSSEGRAYAMAHFHPEASAKAVMDVYHKVLR